MSMVDISEISIVRDFTHPDDCTCYECVGPEYRYSDNGNRFIVNNMKHHTFGEDCEYCGEPKTEYKDLGRKGYYVCWYCTERAGGPLTQ